MFTKSRVVTENWQPAIYKFLSYAQINMRGQSLSHIEFMVKHSVVPIFIHQTQVSVNMVPLEPRLSIYLANLSAVLNAVDT